MTARARSWPTCNYQKESNCSSLPPPPAHLCITCDLHTTFPSCHAFRIPSSLWLSFVFFFITQFTFLPVYSTCTCLLFNIFHCFVFNFAFSPSTLVSYFLFLGVSFCRVNAWLQHAISITLLCGLHLYVSLILPFLLLCPKFCILSRSTPLIFHFYFAV